MSHRRAAHRAVNRAARARLAVGGALAALALAGCSVTNPITTHWDYAASDGVILDVGQLRLGNAIVLTAEEQAPGTLLGWVRNSGTQSTAVTIGVAGGEPASFDVPAGSTVLLGPDGDEQVDVGTVPAAPGSQVDLVLMSDRDGEARSAVPVLDGTLEEYADLVP